MKQKSKTRYFHGLINPTVNSDGSIAWRYKQPNDLTPQQLQEASGWARKVVDLMFGVRVNPISPRERRHI